MKPKLTINTLVKSNLKHRKKQYALMFFGILLSMIFSSTVLFFVSSMNVSVDEYRKNNFGNFSEMYYDKYVSDEFFEKAVENGALSRYSYAHILGKIYSEKNGREADLNVAYLDEKCKDMYFVSLLEGEYPTKEGEIALEEATLLQINPDLKVGDRFKVFMRGQNDTSLLERYEEKTFTLSGVLKNKKSNFFINKHKETDTFMPVPSAFVTDSSIALPGSKELKLAYVDVNGKGNLWYSYLRDRGSLNEDSPIYDSVFKLDTDEYTDKFTNTNTYSLMRMGLVFSLVLLFASSIAIFNSVNSNIAERKKQIGMFRTVGATKRQIRKIFGREAVVISLICAPISTVVSYFAVKLISKLFGEEFVFVLKFSVLLLSVVFGVLCVMLASAIPLLTASKISPVQSIRNIENTRKMKTKIKKSKTEFNVSALLSKRNQVFNRSKQAVVSVFLIVSITFSCYVFSFVKAKTHLFETILLPDYQVINRDESYKMYNLRTVYGFTENNRQDVLNIPQIADVSGAKHCYALIEHDGSSEYFKVFNMFNPNSESENEEQAKEEAKANCKTDSELFGIFVVSCDTDVIKSLEPIKGKIDIEALNSGKKAILLAPEKVAFLHEEYKGGYSEGLEYDENISAENNYIATAERDLEVGDKFTLDVLYADVTDNKSGRQDVVQYDDNLEIENIELFKNEVEIGAIIKKFPSFRQISTMKYSNMFLLTTHEGLKKLCGDVGYYNLSANLKDSEREKFSEQTDKDVLTKLSLITQNLPGYSEQYSYFAERTDAETELKSLFLVALSSMILLMAGSMSIINNSLTARIRENKREIGTLRAVGATQKDLTMSYVRQLLSMFGWGTGLGFGIFFAIYLGVRIYCKVNKYDMLVSLSVWPAIAAVVILFAVCSFNLYLKIKKETKNSIIDNIREL